MSLSDKQVAAAHRLGQDVCVVAGPGSGKTSVLIERFSWLVREKGIEPNRILAITFTEKAATEIKQRLVSAFADDYTVRERIERAYVSTIHAFCTRLLKENAISAGIDPMFEVADQAAAALLQRQAADQILESTYALDPERMRRFLQSLAVATERDGHVPDLAAALIDIYEAMRIAGAPVDRAAAQPPEPSLALDRLRGLLDQIAADRPKINTDKQRAEHGRVAEWSRQVLDLPLLPSIRHFRVLNEPEFFKTILVKGSRARLLRDDINDCVQELRGAWLSVYYKADRELIVDALHDIDEGYRAMKSARSLLDFADLEACAIDLLQSNPDLRVRIQGSFDYILMDELQDTNPLQWKLLDLLRRPGNFFAVGDINQSIFRFRHAEPELFRGYQENLKRQGHTVDELRDNYRSRREVLDTVNHVFLGATGGIVPHTLSGAREFPEKTVPSIELIGAFAEDADDASGIEALWVARRIAELAGTLPIGEPGRTRPVTFADIAVLTRTYAGMEPVQRALEQFGIPSILIGGRTFFEAREVKDLILLLRVLVNPCDEIALAGVLRSPMVGVSDESLWRLRQIAPVHRAFIGGRFSDFDAGERQALEAFHEQVANLRALRDAISPDRLLRRAIDESDYESGLSDRGCANVEKFLDLVRVQFEGSLEELVEKIATFSPAAEAPPSDFGNAVRLMTIHQSKGLEFPVVFLPALNKGTGNGQPIIAYAEGLGLGVKWRDPDNWTAAGDSIYRKIDAADKIKQSHEGERLLYVGMTRAKEHMVLSFAENKKASPEWARFVCTQFGIAADNADNQVMLRNGIRTLLTDQPPEIDTVNPPTAIDSTPVILNRAKVSEQFDSGAPVTAISLFAACPRKYYLSRYLRWQTRTTPIFDDTGDSDTPDLGELDASELGLQVHTLLAGGQVINPDPEAIELADRFHASALGREAAHAKKVEREFDFVMEVYSVVLRGQIDLWFERNGRITIVDYKTDQVTAPVDPGRIQSYALQLQIYALAIEKLTGRLPHHAWLYFLRPDQAVEIDLSPLQLAAARNAVLDLREAQDTGRFPLNEGPHCTRCEFYRGLCPAGRVPMERVEATMNGTFRLPSSSEAQP